MLDQHIPAQYYVLSQMNDYKDILTFIPQLPSTQWVKKLTPANITHPHQLTLVQEQFTQLQQHISTVLNTQLHSQIIAYLCSVHNVQPNSAKPHILYNTLQNYPHPFYSQQAQQSQKMLDHIQTIQAHLNTLQKSLSK
jgi:hypothetical protein